MSPRIEKLLDAVQVMHRCKAEHFQSVPVIEMLGDKVVWDGVVEVFKVEGIKNVLRCYAWSFEDGSETRFVTVLKKPPVMSPRNAVQAFIMDSRKPSGVKVSDPH
ncbi:MAG: hypothetical protein WAK51_15425 [Opitutaceae bacterium]